MSKFLSLNEKDLLKGFILACLSALLTTLYNLLTSGAILGKAQLVSIAVAGVTAGVGYLIKNLFQNSNGNLITPEPPVGI